MKRSIRRVLGPVIVGGLVGLMAPAGAGAVPRLHGAALRQHNFLRYTTAHGRGTSSGNHTPDDGDLADSQAAYDLERTAPASFVSGSALVAASQQSSALPVTGGAWQLATDKPYQSAAPGYNDPNFGNSASGESFVGGRTTAIAQAPDGAWFAGTADGGVWRSTDQGQNWTPVFDQMPSLSIGAVSVNPTDGSVWVGTGEANLSSDSYAGTGIYRSTDDGATFQRVGDTSGGSNPLVSRTIFRIEFDPAGNAYAATNNGLFRMASGSNAWTEVLDPAGPTDFPPYDQQVTSVAVVPGTNGQQVIAAIGWHGPGNTENNGFYQSTNGGSSFRKVTPTGAVDNSDIGRTTFAYSADGKRLYAIVQSLSALATGQDTSLQGIYLSSGSPASVTGPWTKIASSAKLDNSGSALKNQPGYHVGIQAWYNQVLAVDPADHNHVYAGLEEVFESTNAGQTWVTAAPYWNFGLSCPGGCPKTTHPDQHALMIADSKIVSGNDGGVYSRPLADTQQYGDWSDLNPTLASWQYYDARAGNLTGGATGLWGGLQDNGTSWLPSNASQMIEPMNGDGFDVVVDPNNAERMVGEYTDGTMYRTTNAGHTLFEHVSPTCAAQEVIPLKGGPRPDCDPNARFVTPLSQDQQNTNTWVTGGEFVWVTKAGWNTVCNNATCSWKNEFDTGAGHAVTAASSANNGGIVYAAWVAGGNPSPSFDRGIVTNYGGKWHQVSTAGLPERFIAGITADPTNPAHAYAIFNGYSRRWVPGGGVGHVFETTDGGQSWTNISGNLPDIASDALVLRHGQLALATDAGMFTASEGQGTSTSWSRLGIGLPNASVNDVTPGPNGYIYAATHGRGVWRIPFG